MTDQFNAFNPHHAHEKAALEERAKRDCADAKSVNAEPQKLNGTNGHAHNAVNSGIEIINGAEIIPRPIDWIWKSYLARGKLHLLAGAKGAGKTTIAIDLTAAFTTGGLLPDGSRAPIGDVLMWSGEDDVADSLVPRLIASGGDRSRINLFAVLGKAMARGAPSTRAAISPLS